MIPSHHLPEHHLLAYATGDVPEAFSALIAAHLEICESCLLEMKAIEAAGGQLLREHEPAKVDPKSLLERTLSRLDSIEQEESAPVPLDTNQALPPALRAYVQSIEAAPWVQISKGAERVPLVGRAESKLPKLLMYRLQPGQGIIEHDHSGQELMLILEGGLEDGEQHFRRGDVIDSTEGDVHRLEVDTPDPCLCLIANASPIRPTSLMGRLIARWLRL